MVSWRLTDRVLDLLLPGDQERVLLRLARHANDLGASCRPGIRLLTRETGCSERTVQRALLALQRGGYIRPVAYPQGGRGKATEWQLCADRWIVENPVTGDTLLEGNPDTDGTLSGRKPRQIRPERVPNLTQNGVTGDTPVDQEKIKKRGDGGRPPGPPHFSKIADAQIRPPEEYRDGTARRYPPPPATVQLRGLAKYSQ